MTDNMQIIGKGTYGVVIHPTPIVRLEDGTIFDASNKYVLKLLDKIDLELEFQTYQNIKDFDPSSIYHIGDPHRCSFDSETGDKLFGLLYRYGGMTLKQFMTSYPSVDQLMTIFRHLRQAVNVMSSKGIRHMDISSHNIVIDSRGHARLIDFGLAFVGCPSPTYNEYFASVNARWPPELFTLNRKFMTSSAPQERLGQFMSSYDEVVKRHSKRAKYLVRPICDEEIMALVQEKVELTKTVDMFSLGEILIDFIEAIATRIPKTELERLSEIVRILMHPHPDRRNDLLPDGLYEL